MLGVGVAAPLQMPKTYAFLSGHVLALQVRLRFAMNRSPGLGLVPNPDSHLTKNITPDDIHCFVKLT
jgi:hypothetical protein